MFLAYIGMCLGVTYLEASWIPSVVLPGQYYVVVLCYVLGVGIVALGQFCQKYYVYNY
jgi:hypothetical protein